jgi:SAM-dependent methyltransferase
MRERKLFNAIRYVLEDVVPPFLRDSFLFYGLMWLLYRDKTRYQSQFRESIPHLSGSEYQRYYETFPGLDSETDCNQACLDLIVDSVLGESVLDVGCGRGFVANLIQSSRQVTTTGTDFLIEDSVPQRYPNCTFVKSKIEALDFADNQFDTVVCTHTLEHILDLPQALRELRRVAKRRLILVVPREREYRYSFNLHVHFFPYPHSFLKHLSPLPNTYTCKVVDGDIFYVEDTTGV